LAKDARERHVHALHSSWRRFVCLKYQRLHCTRHTTTMPPLRVFRNGYNLLMLLQSGNQLGIVSASKLQLLIYAIPNCC
jgi:hypothetical protein